MKAQLESRPSWELASNTGIAGITWPASNPDPLYVGPYEAWLARHEPAILKEYGQALARGDARALADWVDAMYPYMYEIWCIIRYKGDL